MALVGNSAILGTGAASRAHECAGVEAIGHSIFDLLVPADHLEETQRYLEQTTQTESTTSESVRRRPRRAWSRPRFAISRTRSGSAWSSCARPR
jgi:hypothetical protein